MRCKEKQEGHDERVDRMRGERRVKEGRGRRRGPRRSQRAGAVVRLLRFVQWGFGRGRGRGHESLEARNEGAAQVVECIREEEGERWGAEDEVRKLLRGPVS